MIKANNPKISSWVEIPKNSDFPIQNLPFGVYKTNNTKPRVCSRVGDQVIDLFILSKMGLLDGIKIKKRYLEVKPLIS